MVMTFDELRVLKVAEQTADEIWRDVVQWEKFAQEVVGGQLARAADSIGANIAEAFGRFHYGEKLQFLYFARGSLFETKYWLNRALARNLLSSERAQALISQLADLARQLNSFAAALKSQKQSTAKPAKGTKTLQESTITYATDPAGDTDLFTETDLLWLQTLPNT